MSNYLYNDVELPKLPKWDIELYPYALIGVAPKPSGVKPYTRLYASKSPFVLNEGVLFPFAVSAQTDSYVHSLINEGETEWSKIVIYTQNGVSTNISETIIWTNHDILNEDGSVYFGAICPIDAETGEEYHGWCIHATTAPTDPTSFYFLSGLLFAQKVRLPLV